MRIEGTLLFAFLASSLWAQESASQDLKQALRRTLEMGSWVLQADVTCNYATGPEHRTGTSWFSRTYRAETVGHLTHITAPIEAYREYGGAPGAARKQESWIPMKRLQAGREADALLLPLVSILICAFDHRLSVEWLDDPVREMRFLRAVCPGRIAANLFADVERSGIFEREGQNGTGQRYDDGSGSGEWSAAEILERVDRTRGRVVLDLRLGELGIVEEVFLNVLLAARPLRGGKAPSDWEAAEHIVLSFHYTLAEHGQLEPFPIPAAALSRVYPRR